MRAVLLTLIMVLALSGVAFAKPHSKVGPMGPQGPQGPQGIQGVQGEQGIQGPVGEGVNRQNPAGVGLDAILWQSPKEVFGVAATYRFDERNNEHSTFLVGQINLWKMLKK